MVLFAWTLKRKCTGKELRVGSLKTRLGLPFSGPERELPFSLVYSTLNLSLPSSATYSRVWVREQNPLGLGHRCGPCEFSLGFGSKPHSKKQPILEKALTPCPTCCINTVKGHRSKIGILVFCPNHSQIH